jgi:uncharacterized delta-60 repeat protein
MIANMMTSRFPGIASLAVSVLLCGGVLCTNSSAAPGEVDLSFDPGSGVNGGVKAMAIQPDGRVIIGGEFTRVKGLARASLARLNVDGSGDASFTPVNPVPGTPTLSNVFALALQPDGKVLAAHDYFLGLGQSSVYYGLSRFNPDGTPDPAFITNAITALYGLGTFSIDINCLALQTDGKVLVSGPEFLIRLHSNGTRDTNFNVNLGNSGVHIPYRFEVAPDNKVVVIGNVMLPNSTTVPGIARFLADGSVDTNFNSFISVEHDTLPPWISGVTMQPDGKALIFGLFTKVNGIHRPYLARLNADGSLDSGFNPTNGASMVAVLPDGKIHLGNARLNADGSRDTSFNLDTGSELISLTDTPLALQANGKFILSADILTSLGSRKGLMRFHANGALDSHFHSGRSVLLEAPHTLLVQPDGKVLFSAITGSLGSGVRPFILGTNAYAQGRLNRDGSLDNTFIGGGPFNPDVGADPEPGYWVVQEVIHCLAVQADDKVLYNGYTVAETCQGEDGCWTTNYPYLHRFHPDGARDTNFIPAVSGCILAQQPDGKLLVGETSLARLNLDGSLDSSFAPGVQGVSVLALQPDGKLLIGGTFTVVHGVSRRGIARLKPDGTLDTTFNPGTGTDGTVNAIALQPDGKVLLGGSFTHFDGVTRHRVARLHADGGLDAGFDPGVGPDGHVVSLVMQPDGNILIGGDFRTVGGALRSNVARLYGDSAPTLSMARSNAFLIISWPNSATGFLLQQSTDLTTTNWTTPSEAVTDNGAVKSISVSPTAGNRFFRLFKP